MDIENDRPIDVKLDRAVMSKRLDDLEIEILFPTLVNFSSPVKVSKAVSFSSKSTPIVFKLLKPFIVFRLKFCRRNKDPPIFSKFESPFKLTKESLALISISSLEDTKPSRPSRSVNDV